ncbi:defensin-like protein CAL1 [Panicum virgatum]|uniref:Knottins-like domain-containing protein n=1 Tax=Panicum virgatum TaxID=38727 RepID=A0A8T0WXC7_PANVG|nr:defensin-like protein CAL1 [Panicum virgatum]KAG2652500.1 hypothetical protein PVAP13_1NG358238 [Panicum virgatum]
MALSRGMVLFFLLLLVAAEIGTIDAKKKSKFAKKTAKSLTKDKEEEKKEEEEKNHCLSQSHHFKGFCLSSDTCAEVCQKEGFHGGECKLHNAMRKCFCKKPC